MPRPICERPLLRFAIVSHNIRRTNLHQAATIPDILNKGAELLADKVASSTGNDGDDDVETQPELEDIIEELL